MSLPDEPRRVIIVGGGLAGLSCALHLQRAGLRPTVLEAADAVGGRVRTDREQGFLLDRGFQVLLTAYPEFRDLVGEQRLKLGRFRPGALVRAEGRFQRVVDPLRVPSAAFDSLRARIGSLGDKWRTLQLRRDATRGSLSELFARPETSTEEALRARGFSDRMIERFFRPFLGGIFLDSSLHTSSRMMEFVMRMFTEGDAALPEGGMEALPRALASQLEDGVVRTQSPVREVRADGVLLQSGEELSGTVVLATDAEASARFGGAQLGPRWNSTRCLFFAAERSPLSEPILVLNGEGRGLVNTLCVPSDVQAGYAESGALVSVSVLGGAEAETDLEAAVRPELESWFGQEARDWKHLRTTRVPHALPVMPTMTGQPRTRTADGRHFVCGDHCSHPSVQGAMSSGRATAQAVVEGLGQIAAAR